MVSLFNPNALPPCLTVMIERHAQSFKDSCLYRGAVLLRPRSPPLLEWEGCLLWTLKSGLKSEKVYVDGV